MATLRGSDGRDSLRGTAGDDRILGLAGADQLIGGLGDDEILGGPGRDQIFGLGGADRLFGGDGNDQINGGAGDDQIWGEAGADVLAGGAGNDRMSGGTGNDRMSGQAGADVLAGGRGNDRLDGGAGEDRLSGGAGDDRLFGGRGVDVLTGGPGADQFVYRLADEGLDRITDFDPDQGDTLTLTGALAGAAVRTVDDGTNTTVQVRTADADGFTDLVVLEGYREPIDVWYGDQQQFGDPGEAQRWVNILGTAAPTGLASLSYALNGGEEQALSFGPFDPNGRPDRNFTRLVEEGDFNIELDYAELNPTAVDDVVSIRATYGNGEVFTRDVTIEYEDGQAWPTTYSIDWENVTHLQDVVQVVDGLWSFDDGGVRPAVQGYDRVLALGDASWDSYEVELSIEMHDLHTVDPRGRDLGGFLLGLQWNGHTSNPVGGDESPHIGWIPGGAFFFRGNQTDRVTSVELRPTEWFPAPVASQPLQLLEGHTYNFRIQNERDLSDLDPSDGFDRTYRLRVWEQGTPEPTGWLIEQTVVDQTPTGGFYLNAHYFDVTFGDLSVTPLPGDEILVSQNSLSPLLGAGADDARPVGSTAGGTGGGDAGGGHEPVGLSQSLAGLVVSGDEAALAA